MLQISTSYILRLIFLTSAEGDYFIFLILDLTTASISPLNISTGFPSVVFQKLIFCTWSPALWANTLTGRTKIQGSPSFWVQQKNMKVDSVSPQEKTESQNICKYLKRQLDTCVCAI